MALIIRIGFWGPFYYNYDKEAPIIVQVFISASIVFELVYNPLQNHCKSLQSPGRGFLQKWSVLAWAWRCTGRLNHEPSIIIPSARKTLH